MNTPPTTGNQTLGVYVQVPFCASKCTFCNFSSQVDRSTLFEQYADLLQRELHGWPSFYGDGGIPEHVLALPVDSLYFGGGTPTLLGAERLRLIVRGLQERLSFSNEVEFTLETTPGSATANLLMDLREIGINRLSIGAQTFDDRELKAVGRLHSAAETGEVVRGARDAGFPNINLDLIAGLPFQTERSFLNNLESAAKLRPEHLSLYLFEVDDKSRLGNEVVHGGNRYHAGTVPSDDFMAEAYESACVFLAREGYIQYEISNFALPGFESRHNRKYWELAPYLGLGAGAHSFDGLRRWSNCVEVQSYRSAVADGQTPIDQFRVLTLEEQLEEFFFLGLRQVQGIDLGVARRQWGAAQIDPWMRRIESLAADGWLLREGDNVRLSPRSYLISNEIFQEFVSV